ncbi:MAG: hypothetical protein LBL30_03995 [Holosporales bacterium]|nr:hypothetical protein [Holosporales bacterium]
MKIGNYFTPYLLAGIEFNTLNGVELPCLRNNGIARYNFPVVGTVGNFPADRVAYCRENNKIIRNNRLGCGFELAFFKRFKFRFDFFWIRKSKFDCNFSTETIVSGPGWVDRLGNREYKLPLRHKKFSTRFGIIMDL